MEPIDTMAALLAIEDELQACAGIDVGQIGIPEDLSNGTVASVSVLDGPKGRAPLSKHGISQNFLLLWESQVNEDERGTELRLATFKDDWRRRWLAFRQDAAHALAGADWDDSISARPEYVRKPGEARQFPSVLTVPMTDAAR